MSLAPIFTVLFWVDAWFSMEGFRILKIRPLKIRKKNPNKHDHYHSIRHKDCRGKGLKGKNEPKERSN